MKIILTESQYKMLLEIKQEKSLRLKPYKYFDDWDLINKFVERRGNPSIVSGMDIDMIKNQFNEKGKLISRPFTIEGEVRLYPSLKIHSLGNLIKIIGNLLIFSLKEGLSLGNLQIVEGDFYLERTPIETLGNLKTIRGSLYLENSDLHIQTPTSLGNLTSVGKNVILSNTVSLGNLIAIGGNLDSGKHLKSLGNLKTIGGYADFKNSKIDSLGNLKYVGGPYLNLTNTPLSQKYSMEEIEKMIDIPYGKIIM